MRLCAPVPFDGDLEQWLLRHDALGYGAAFCPLGLDADAQRRGELVRLAARHGVVITEVGAWRNNPLHPDPVRAEQGIVGCIAKLQLAEDVGARTCVNIAGSLGEGSDGATWHGPHRLDLGPDAFDRIVEAVRRIIDAVRPTRSAFALETMPWMLPDSPQSYLDLLRAIDRPAFAVHLDPVNMISSPRIAFATGRLIDDCFDLLGPWIRSCHAKDIVLGSTLTVHLSEAAPGTGLLDYPRYLRRLAALPGDVALAIEHLPDQEAYLAAADRLRAMAASQGLAFARQELHS